MFYIPYLLRHRADADRGGCAGTGRAPDHGAYFSLGRWGLPVNVFAVVYGILMTINLAWPRGAVYGTDHWYFQYGAFVFIGVIVLVGWHLLLRCPARQAGRAAARAPRRDRRGARADLR